FSPLQEFFYFYNYICPSTPSPKRAKSYFTGYPGSNNLKFSVSSMAAFHCNLVKVLKGNLRATRSTCTSQGAIRGRGLIRFNTPASSARTIQRRNIFSLLQVDFCWGELTCLRVRKG